MGRWFIKLRDMGPKAILVVLAAVLVVASIVAGVVIGSVEAKQAIASRENTERYRMNEAKREQAELARLDEIYLKAKELAHQAMPGFLLLGDNLSGRKKVIKYARKLKNHNYSYCNGVYAYSIGRLHKKSAPAMGNAVHTDTK